MLKENVTVTSSAITQGLAEVGKKMLSHQVGFGDYTFQGEVRRTFYAPTQEGQVVALVFPKSAMDALVNSLAVRQLVAGLVAIPTFARPGGFEARVWGDHPHKPGAGGAPQWSPSRFCGNSQE